MTGLIKICTQIPSPMFTGWPPRHLIETLTLKIVKAYIHVFPMLAHWVSIQSFTPVSYFCLILVK